MRRNNEQAELTKRLNSETKSGSVYRQSRALLRRHLRLVALLCFALSAMHGLALRALGQAKSVPDLVRIEVAKPPTQPLEYRFAGKEPQKETELELKGDGQDWSYVYFGKFPANVSLKIKGQPDGYDNYEVIKPDGWYWFKKKLPLILEIKPDAQSPVNIDFWFGSPNKDADKEQAKSLRPEEMRAFIANHEIKPDTKDKLTVGFTWEVPGGAILFTKASPVAVIIPEPAWTNYMIEEHPLVLYLILFLSLGVIVFFLVYVLPNIIDFIWRLTKRKPRKPSRSRQATATAKPVANDGDMYASLGGDKAKPTTQEMSAPVHSAVANRSQRTQAERDRQPLPGEVVTPTARAHAPEASQTLVEQKPGTQRESSRMPQPGEVVVPSPKPPTKPKSSDAKPVAQNEPITVSPAPATELELMGLRADLDRLRERGDEKSERLIMHFKDELNSIHNQLARIGEQQEKLNYQQQEQQARLKASANGIDELRAEIGKVRSEFKELSISHGETQALDSFYAKTLGAIIGQNVESLQDGNFERLMVEWINQFFRLGIPHGDKLQGLRVRAEAINVALKEVVAQMAGLSPQAAEEASTHLQRGAALAAELGALQTQLQNRRVNIETTLRLPISIHANARQSFLEELARGIRREMDKLSEPHSHFEGELKHFLTTDIIPVVDICDKKIAHPGTRPELEAPLNQLFAQAGLLPIMPHQGEPLKAGEHELSKLVQSERGQSSSIAHVVTRGFYYAQPEGKTLLRKAVVAVYR